MALLDTTGEQRVWRGLMRFWSRDGTHQDTPFTKAELLSAVQAINVYLDDAAINRPATSINAAFPAGNFRNNASVAVKGQVVAAVALAQTGNVALLRAMLGEVDG